MIDIFQHNSVDSNKWSTQHSASKWNPSMLNIVHIQHKLCTQKPNTWPSLAYYKGIPNQYIPFTNKLKLMSWCKCLTHAYGVKNNIPLITNILTTCIISTCCCLLMMRNWSFWNEIISVIMLSTQDFDGFNTI
jgi:hypothetical protein